jgi:hypothetical protein
MEVTSVSLEFEKHNPDAVATDSNQEDMSR